MLRRTWKGGGGGRAPAMPGGGCGMPGGAPPPAGASFCCGLNGSCSEYTLFVESLAHHPAAPQAPHSTVGVAKSKSVAYLFIQQVNAGRGVPGTKTRLLPLSASTPVFFHRSHTLWFVTSKPPYRSVSGSCSDNTLFVVTLAPYMFCLSDYTPPSHADTM